MSSPTKRTEGPATPIRSWKLRNFKSVREAEIPLAALTVLVGPNSSGKSTVLQSMLLVAQSAWQSANETNDRHLALNGRLVELGIFDDVFHDGQPEGGADRERSSFSIGGDFKVDIRYATSHSRTRERRSFARSGQSISWLAAFQSVKGERDLGVASLGGCTLTVRMTVPDDYGKSKEIELAFSTSGPARKELQVAPLTEWPFSVGSLHPPGEIDQLKGRVTGDHRTIKTAALTQWAGIPVQFYCAKDEAELRLERLFSMFRSAYRAADKPRDAVQLSPASSIELLSDQIVKRLTGYAKRSLEENRSEEESRLFNLVHQLRGEFGPRSEFGHGKLADSDLDRVLDRAREAALASMAPLGEVLVPADRQGPAQVLGDVGRSLARLLSRQILYLGPLRENPRLLSISTKGSRPGDVGSKGERTIAMLQYFSEKLVTCPTLEGGWERWQLRRAVNYWLKAFGIADSVETALRPRLGLETRLNVEGVGHSVDLTGVGVGVSQVLPVLVMGLHAEPETILLMEQPELHLHPQLQQLLGDFLLGCARTGKQIIVETHSDHLVSRLRRRVAEDEADELRSYIALIFAERDEGQTSFRSVDINRYGAIEDWPRGFFDQSARESQEILRAGIAKKRGETASHD